MFDWGSEICFGHDGDVTVEGDKEQGTSRICRAQQDERLVLI
jgi:hypothetical protein